MTRGLINHLKANPDISHVYLNAQGGWLFDPNRLHPIVKNRQEILDMEDSLPIEQVTKDELGSLIEENRLLKEKIEMLELEKSILEEDKAAHQAKVTELEEQLKTVSEKTKKLKNVTT